MAALCGGSLAAAALSVARGALDERRLVGMDVSDLSALASARAGTVGAPMRKRRQEIELQPLETRTSRGAIAYLKVEKPHFLFLDYSTGAAVAAAVTTASL
jgi:RecB family exonuclease